MRGLGLLRAARQAALAAEPLGLERGGAACASGAPGGLPAALRQLSSLMGPAQPHQDQRRQAAPPAAAAGWQRQQAAGFAAARRVGPPTEPPSSSSSDEEELVGSSEEEELVVPAALMEDEDDELEPHSRGPRHNKLKHSERRNLLERKLWRAREEAAEEEAEAAASERHWRITGLLSRMAQPNEAASSFVSSFFAARGGAAAGSGGARGGEAGGEEGALPDWDELAAAGAADEEAAAPPPPDEEWGGLELERRLRGLRQGSRRVILEEMMRGGVLREHPRAQAELAELERQFEPPPGFRMKVVDVNRTCKGTRTGGLYKFGCMVVVGNGNGVLGWGQGKSAEVNSAVQKAYLRACRNLYPVPRYNQHTITHPIKHKFGQVKLTLYPKASGNGIMANPLMAEICKMAGIHDVGIKVHGSRNTRNAVKCLFEAFDRLRTEDEIMDGAEAQGSFVVKMPPGRYRFGVLAAR